MNEYSGAGIKGIISIICNIADYWSLGYVHLLGVKFNGRW